MLAYAILPAYMRNYIYKEYIYINNMSKHH